MSDETTIFHNGVLPQIGATDIVVTSGTITSIGKVAEPTNANIVDLGGNLVLPGLVDGHMHLDKTLFGLPWMPHAAGPTRMSRIETDKEILPNLPLPTRHRAALLLDRCIANGTAHVRTHVDIHLEMGLTPLHEILAVREAYRDRVTIEIVAFPQGGVVRCPGVIDLMDAALGAGADLVGGIDPSVIDRDARGQLDVIFALADKRGVAIDIHLHEPGELGLFSLEEICARTKAMGLEGKVTISHAFCLGMVPESAARNAAELLGRTGVAIATHGAGGSIIPPILMLRDAGVNVFAGNDDVRDTWSPLRECRHARTCRPHRLEERFSSRRARCGRLRRRVGRRRQGPLDRGLWYRGRQSGKFLHTRCLMHSGSRRRPSASPARGA